MNRPTGRFVLRSLGATAIGWFVPPAVFCMIPAGGNAPIGRFVAFSWIMGMWVVPSWLLVVLPLALFVSQNSRFWHPLIVGPLGLIVAGVILVGSVLVMTSGTGELQVRSLMPTVAIACAVGLVTGLMLSYLFRTRVPNNFPHPTPPSRRG